MPSQHSDIRKERPTAGGRSQPARGRGGGREGRGAGRQGRGRGRIPTRPPHIAGSWNLQPRHSGIPHGEGEVIGGPIRPGITFAESVKGQKNAMTTANPTTEDDSPTTTWLTPSARNSFPSQLRTTKEQSTIEFHNGFEQLSEDEAEDDENNCEEGVLAPHREEYGAYGPPRQTKKKKQKKRKKKKYERKGNSEITPTPAKVIRQQVSKEMSEVVRALTTKSSNEISRDDIKHLPEPDQITLLVSIACEIAAKESALDPQHLHKYWIGMRKNTLIRICNNRRYAKKMAFEAIADGEPITTEPELRPIKLPCAGKEVGKIMTSTPSMSGMREIILRIAKRVYHTQMDTIGDMVDALDDDQREHIIREEGKLASYAKSMGITLHFIPPPFIPLKELEDNAWEDESQSAATIPSSNNTSSSLQFSLMQYHTPEFNQQSWQSKRVHIMRTLPALLRSHFPDKRGIMARLQQHKTATLIEHLTPPNIRTLANAVDRNKPIPPPDRDRKRAWGLGSSKTDEEYEYIINVRSAKSGGSDQPIGQTLRNLVENSRDLLGRELHSYTLLPFNPESELDEYDSDQELPDDNLLQFEYMGKIVQTPQKWTQFDVRIRSSFEVGHLRIQNRCPWYKSYCIHIGFLKTEQIFTSVKQRRKPGFAPLFMLLSSSKIDDSSLIRSELTSRVSTELGMELTQDKFDVTWMEISTPPSDPQPISAYAQCVLTSPEHEYEVKFKLGGLVVDIDPYTAPSTAFMALTPGRRDPNQSAADFRRTITEQQNFTNLRIFTTVVNAPLDVDFLTYTVESEARMYDDPGQGRGPLTIANLITMSKWTNSGGKTKLSPVLRVQQSNIPGQWILQSSQRHKQPLEEFSKKIPAFLKLWIGEEHATGGIAMKWDGLYKSRPERMQTATDQVTPSPPKHHSLANLGQLPVPHNKEDCTVSKSNEATEARIVEAVHTPPTQQATNCNEEESEQNHMQDEHTEATPSPTGEEIHRMHVSARTASKEAQAATARMITSVKGYHDHTLPDSVTTAASTHATAALTVETNKPYSPPPSPAPQETISPGTTPLERLTILFEKQQEHITALQKTVDTLTATLLCQTESIAKSSGELDDIIESEEAQLKDMIAKCCTLVDACAGRVEENTSKVDVVECEVQVLKTILATAVQPADNAPAPLVQDIVSQLESNTLELKSLSTMTMSQQVASQASQEELRMEVRERDSTYRREKEGMDESNKTLSLLLLHTLNQVNASLADILSKGGDPSTEEEPDSFQNMNKLFRTAESEMQRLVAPLLGPPHLNVATQQPSVNAGDTARRANVIEALGMDMSQEAQAGSSTNWGNHNTNPTNIEKPTHRLATENKKALDGWFKEKPQEGWSPTETEESKPITQEDETPDSSGKTSKWMRPPENDLDESSSDDDSFDQILYGTKELERNHKLSNQPQLSESETEDELSTGTTATEQAARDQYAAVASNPDLAHTLPRCEVCTGIGRTVECCKCSLLFHHRCHFPNIPLPTPPSWECITCSTQSEVDESLPKAIVRAPKNNTTQQYKTAPLDSEASTNSCSESSDSTSIATAGVTRRYKLRSSASSTQPIPETPAPRRNARGGRVSAVEEVGTDSE